MAHCVDPSVIAKSNLKILVGATNLEIPTITVLYPEHFYANPIYDEPLDRRNPVLGDLSIIKVV
jgi:hypothetical protein